MRHKEVKGCGLAVTALSLLYLVPCPCGLVCDMDFGAERQRKWNGRGPGPENRNNCNGVEVHCSNANDVLEEREGVRDEKTLVPNLFRTKYNLHNRIEVGNYKS